jgi:hypothetical protein
MYRGINVRILLLTSHLVKSLDIHLSLEFLDSQDYAGSQLTSTSAIRRWRRQAHVSSTLSAKQTFDLVNVVQLSTLLDPDCANKR